MAIKLSILIATMPSRADKLFRLTSILSPQLVSVTEIIDDCSLGYNIGTKRNKLLQKARGEYIVFIDDDDMVSGDYISKILSAVESGPDCVGISGVITINAGMPKQWHISKEYGYWHEANNIYYRTPNHISPVKRELALQAGFPEISFGEDAEYSKRLLPLLKTETVVPQNIYTYIYVDK